jgi:hypothetical protein
MGERALFIEHPANHSNRVKLANVPPAELPWKDTQKLPYTITGPYVSELIRRVFIDGLHHPTPGPRPTSGKLPWSRQPICSSPVRTHSARKNGSFSTTPPNPAAHIAARHFVGSCRF